MRIFKTKWFSKFAKSYWISDEDLCEAIGRAERGLIDANLGDGVIKQRIARQGEGKSGGFRTIVLLRREERAFFVYGFLKSEQANVTPNDVKEFRKMAITLLQYTNEDLEFVLAEMAIVEVKIDE